MFYLEGDANRGNAHVINSFLGVFWMSESCLISSGLTNSSYIDYWAQQVYQIALKYNVWVDLIAINQVSSSLWYKDSNASRISMIRVISSINSSGVSTMVSFHKLLKYQTEETHDLVPGGGWCVRFYLHYFINTSQMWVEY